MQPPEILRMNMPRAKVRGGDVFDDEAGIVEQRLVRVDRSSVGVEDHDGLGDRIRDSPELVLVSPQLLLRLLAVFDVRAGPTPPDDLPAFVTQRLDADEKPAKHPVVPPKAHLDLARFARG